jgi:tetratricopeptide (TPR) repeat protein
VALRQSGAVLLVAGRYREAEEVLRRAAARQATGLEQAGTLDYLGNVLMEQSRYDEAMRSFQAARHAAPGSRRPYRGMAETLLRQGKNPEQALEYVEGIVGSSGPSARGRLLSDRVQDDYWALKAWALGQLGRSAEVAPAIEKALKATSRKSRPDLAATYYRAGMAMEAVGNASAARDYFKRAVELDPTGRRGTLAQAALRQTGIRSK